ncbi:MAG: TetR/AcrR family transcriptional regulator [Coriobacteriales bacterium]|jgi:AcrR family transcriptional regulator
MRERPDDLRVTKTIRSIHTAFEQMMCEMDYRQITVKELCERALVNKKTFYRYYETMDFLLAEFQETMMADYLARVEDLRVPDDLDRITHEFFAFAGERGEVFERITCAGPHESLQRQMTEDVLERHDGAAVDDPERSLLMAFVAESTLAVYRQWVADGKRVPLEKAADLAARYVCHGAL